MGHNQHKTIFGQEQRFGDVWSISFELRDGLAGKHLRGSENLGQWLHMPTSCSVIRSRTSDVSRCQV